MTYLFDELRVTETSTPEPARKQRDKVLIKLRRE